MTLGEMIVNRRTQFGLSQRELASRLGITATRLNYWEKDKREPDVEMIKLISNVLSISADELIGNDPKNWDIKEQITSEEIRLLAAYRAADPVYQGVVLEMLETHPVECEASNTA